MSDSSEKKQSTVNVLLDKFKEIIESHPCSDKDLELILSSLRQKTAAKEGSASQQITLDTLPNMNLQGTGQQKRSVCGIDTPNDPTLLKKFCDKNSHSLGCGCNQDKQVTHTKVWFLNTSSCSWGTGSHGWGKCKSPSNGWGTNCAVSKQSSISKVNTDSWAVIQNKQVLQF